MLVARVDGLSLGLSPQFDHGHCRFGAHIWLSSRLTARL
jgi:hypothetical protein